MKLINRNINSELKQCLLLLEKKDFKELIPKLESLNLENKEIVFEDPKTFNKLIVKLVD